MSYWPLDEVVGTKTPDLASGYDMELANLTAADLVAGKIGKAFKFENTRQTMLKRISSPGEQLPINQHPAFTITFWANVTGTGLSDLRLFSEGNTGDNNPLFNLGTANTGDNGTLDFYSTSIVMRSACLTGKGAGRTWMRRSSRWSTLMAT